ncbi:sigma 54-interacting transcriptional regulator [Peribacillus frigoritolerans]|nr:sigma 54-interacting transcriptional regulator [Peribacillus frigoritolerans]
MQSRLLRVLQEREIMRIGDDKVIQVDVRIVSATNKDLMQMVKSNDFREDLYYRLSVLDLVLPPLSGTQRRYSVIGECFYSERSYGSETNQDYGNCHEKAG